MFPQENPQISNNLPGSPLHPTTTTTSNCPRNTDILKSKPSSRLPPWTWKWHEDFWVDHLFLVTITYSSSSNFFIQVGTFVTILYSFLQSTTLLNYPHPSTPNFPLFLTALPPELLRKPLLSHCHACDPGKIKCCSGGCFLFALSRYLFLEFFQTYVASTLWNNCSPAYPVTLPKHLGGTSEIRAMVDLLLPIDCVVGWVEGGVCCHTYQGQLTLLGKLTFSRT